MSRSRIHAPWRRALVTLSGIVLGVAVMRLAAAAPAEGRARLDADGDGVVSREEAAARPKLAGRFDAIDGDGDGVLSREELQAHRRSHAGMQDRKQRWAQADADGDGRISRAEAEANLPKLAQRFDRMDRDGDGYLTREDRARPSARGQPSGD